MGAYKEVLGFLLVMLLTYYGVNGGAGPEENSTVEERPHSPNGLNETKKSTLPVSDSSNDVTTTGEHFTDVPTTLGLNEVGKIVVSKDNQRKRRDRKRRDDEEANGVGENYLSEDSGDAPGPIPAAGSPASGAAQSPSGGGSGPAPAGGGSGPAPPGGGSGPAPPGGGSGPAPAGGATSAPSGGGAPAPGGDKSGTTKAPGSGGSKLFNWQTYILLLTTILAINELCVHLNSRVV